MTKYFDNKVIWITGASSGIGESIAKWLIQNTTAKLVLSARNENKLNELSKLTSNDRVLVLPFDLSTDFNAQQLASMLIEKFGRIDILINNGGASQRIAALDTHEKIERQLFEINYFSYVKLSKAVLPYMIQNHYGHIVVLSSIAGKFGFYLRSTYSAAKHALHGYFESLRLEYEKNGIYVTIVCPGKIKTNISVNAITKDGHTHNQMDPSHQNAMSADKASVKILKGISKQKEEIYVGGKELLMVYFRRYCPFLFHWLIRKQSPF